MNIKDNFDNLSQSLNNPTFFREFLYFIVGFVFLFIINFFIKIDIKNLDNIKLLNNTQIFITIIIFSYFFGRLIVIIGNSYLSSVFKVSHFILSEKKDHFFYVLADNYKKIFSGNKAPIKYIPEEQKTVIELRRWVKKEENCFINEELNRSLYDRFFMSGISGIVIIVLIIKFSLLFFIFLLLITLYSTKSRYDELLNYLELFSHMEKDKNIKN